MLNHDFLEAVEGLAIIDWTYRAAQAELSQIASDGTALCVGPLFQERTSGPGISRAIARKSSVANLR